MNQLSEFIREQMYKRRVKEREFAALVGVSHSVINRYANADTTGYNSEPTLTFLSKLAKATQTDVCRLVKMALNEPLEDNQRIETVQSIAQTMRGLPETMRESVAKQLTEMLYTNILKALKDSGSDP